VKPIALFAFDDEIISQGYGIVILRYAPGSIVEISA
jgi:hypothetical protein